MNKTRLLALVFVWTALLMLVACDSAKEEPPPPAKPPAVEMVAPAAPVPAGLVTWTGDLPTLMEKRVLRMLVVYSKTFYFIDKGQQRGISYELGTQLEKQ